MAGLVILQRFRRRSRPDADAAQRLAAGERVLWSEAGPDGSRRVATDRALHHRSPPGPGWDMFAWSAVEFTGRSPEGSLVVTLRDGPGPRLAVSPASRLPAVVADRVAACRLLTRRLVLPNGHPVLVRAIRAHPGAGIVWTIESAGPADESELADALAAVRALAGC